MNSVVILPDDGEAAADPRARQVLEEARLEMAERMPDYNESRYSGEFNAGIDFQRQHQKVEAPAQPERAPATEETTSPAPRGKSAVDTADGESSRQTQSWPSEAIREFASQPSEEPEPIDEIEFFKNPAEAVAKAVSQHPVVSSLKNAIAATYQRKASEEFAREFPKATETLSDPSFQNWVDSSSIRRELLTRAHREYDLDAARHVFSSWDALRGAKQNNKVRVYRRSDVQRLRESDPARYEELEPTITLAYKQGRVRDI